jgi:two-component system response regulator AtoC
MARRVLIIDDEEGIRIPLALFLEDEGYRAETAGNAEEALERVASASFDVIVSDVRMPGRSGLDLLPDLIRAQPDATILMMSAYGAVDQALEAVRLGAFDYLAKPFQPDELLLTIRKVEERETLRRENRRLRRELDVGAESRPFVAASQAMREVYALVEKASEYKTTVLITGESGVGKEVVARAIHDLSGRAERPFIPINCAAIPETLIESELFGHARGAFTGADSARPGLFREADGGTLFLDEVAELPPAMQAKLLRVLQEEEVRPVGESKPTPIDVRILAATARPLEDDEGGKSFRRDLYYRLNVFRIHLAPLRERVDDIPLLADHFVAHKARRLGKEVPSIGAEVMAALRTYAWPGNVRELENTLERALILATGGQLTLDLFPFGAATLPAAPSGAVPAIGAESDEDLSIKRRGRDLEQRLIRLALERTGGNRTRAASILEISTRALQYKIKEYGIEL